MKNVKKIGKLVGRNAVTFALCAALAILMQAQVIFAETTSETGTTDAETTDVESTDVETTEEETIISYNQVDKNVYAVFTDRHANPDLLTANMSLIGSEHLFPCGVCAGGDMVGERGGDAPEFLTSDVVDDITCVFPRTKVKILEAAHDLGAVDDAGVLVTEAYGEIVGNYAVFYLPQDYIPEVDRDTGEEGSPEQLEEALEEFKDFVGRLDPRMPIVFISHVPFDTSRSITETAANDMYDSLVWAASGGRTVDDPVVRNVFFFHGHNHTIDTTEYLYNVGDTINVFGSDEKEINFTYCTAGYIKTDATSSILQIKNDKIILYKADVAGEDDDVTEDTVKVQTTVKRVLSHPSYARELFPCVGKVNLKNMAGAKVRVSFAGSDRAVEYIIKYCFGNGAWMTRKVEDTHVDLGAPAGKKLMVEVYAVNAFGKSDVEKKAITVDRR
ncbi:MAG: hypothetical protein K5840_08230 [Eubacterium sp.]|nr:hypothetical protein [Eubacterium sp.]